MFRGWLSRISIFAKLMLSGVLVLSCACFFVSFFLIRNTELLLRENGLNQTEQEMADIVDAYASALTAQYATLEQLADYQPLSDFLERDLDTNYELYVNFTSTVGPWLEWLKHSQKTVDMKIYMDEEYQSISSITGGKLDQLSRQDWYLEPVSQFDTVHTAFAPMVINGRRTDAVIYYRNVWEPFSAELKRVIVVSQGVDDLRRGIFADEGYYYLIDPEGMAVSSNQPDAQGCSMEDVLLKLGVAEEQLTDGATVCVNGEECFVRLADFYPENAGLSGGWRVLYLREYKQIVQGIQTQVLHSAMICALIVMIALAIVLGIAHNITSRLNLLIQKIQILGTGDFSTHIEVPGRDEISRISHCFDDMRGHIDRLIRDKIVACEEKVAYERKQNELMMSWRDAEYQVLRAQINPHFLFNTLESIRMSLLMDGEREVARVMRIFADTMREYMDVDRLYAALGEELQFLGYYMEIQRFRMGDRVRYQTCVPKELAEVQVPRLLLQPLVENAINHGIDPKVEGGTVRLTVRREVRWLVIGVSDDGIGMSGERLAALRASLLDDSGNGAHLGLRNVYKRLKLLFGEDGRLEIDSTEGFGSLVTIRLPVFEKEKSPCTKC